MEFPDVTVNMFPTDRELSPEEKVRLDAWLSAAMRAREYAWTEYQSGNVDEEHWRNERAVIQVILGTKRTQDWWTSIARDVYRPDFAAEVDRLINQGPGADYLQEVMSIK